MKKHRFKRIKLGISFQLFAILYLLVYLVAFATSPTTAFFHSETVKLDGNILTADTFSENVDVESVEADEAIETVSENEANTESTVDGDKQSKDEASTQSTDDGDKQPKDEANHTDKPSEEEKAEKSVKDGDEVEEKDTDEAKEDAKIAGNE